MIKSAIKEYVFPADTITKSCHASTVLPLADGTVLAAWFGGTKEKDDDVEIFIAKRSPDGRWSEPVAVTERDDIAHWNPVLHERENGEIILYYKYGREIADWITKYVVSRDSGLTWSAPEELVPGDTSGGRGPVKNKCIRISDGRLLAPASTEQHRKWIPFVDISPDDGISWSRCENMLIPTYKGRKVGLIQPTLWQDTTGRIHAFMRSDAGAIYESRSDDGVSWSKPARTRLPNNNSGIDLVADEEKRVWLIYNPVDVNWGVRHPLSLAVSVDNGKHFREVLVPEPGNGEFSYPAITCRDRVLYITYTYKRKQIVFWKIELE